MIVKGINTSIKTCLIIKISKTLIAKVNECPMVKAVTNTNNFFHSFTENNTHKAIMYKIWS
jgi:hypothetical protein